MDHADLSGVGTYFLDDSGVEAPDRKFIVRGTDGDDVIAGPLFGTNVSTDVYGGAGNDILSGPIVYGEGRDDRLSGRFLYGGAGDDRLVGSDGEDQLDGGPGRDLLTGGGDRDSLVGGVGRDVLSGGGGVDQFHFFLGDGQDRIADLGVGDVLIFYDLYSASIKQAAVGGV